MIFIRKLSKWIKTAKLLKMSMIFLIPTPVHSRFSLKEVFKYFKSMFSQILGPPLLNKQHKQHDHGLIPLKCLYNTWIAIHSNISYISDLILASLKQNSMSWSCISYQILNITLTAIKNVKMKTFCFGAEPLFLLSPQFPHFTFVGFHDKPYKNIFKLQHIFYLELSKF